MGCYGVLLGVLEGYCGVPRRVHRLPRVLLGYTASGIVARRGRAVLIARPVSGGRPRLRACVCAIGQFRVRWPQV